ncbi:uncharacterized protein Tco025E_02428 [Trypanosoma conorhini]|uniref:Uncharacterized protein n=1 Tax=Trypanosoma conorhini TaxID=83891 RepID=A0A422Q3X2_9TRYP|nr:uncharacterized protein Tco025E_02428 [Trypanosoma conorhini]RNF24669.1 hypothetical protein Tco025E_02428 [Trypanosoma conorhini]
MLDNDWLRSSSLPADGPPVDRGSVGRDATAAANSGSPRSEGQGLLVGVGIGSIAAYLIYAMYRASHRGAPQLFWAPSSVTASQSSPSCHAAARDGAADLAKTPTLTLVNFPKQLWGCFERCLRPLINAEELSLRAACVVFFHEVTEVTPNNVEAVVRQEVVSAFNQLKGAPCAVYRSALALDGEPASPFWGPEEAVTASRGRAFLERHCIGYTVDGGRVEVLFHDTKGMVGAVANCAAAMQTDRHLDDVDDALRRCFCATTRTFSPGKEEGWDAVGAFSSSGPGKCIDGPYARSFGALWLSPVPLFAMFGAAVRYSRAEFDGWRRLSDPDAGDGSPLWLVRRVWQWWQGRKQSKLGVSTGESSKGDTFTVEIEFVQDSASTETNCSELFEDAMKSTRRCCGDKGTVKIVALPSALGTILRCSLRPGLTVFQALWEAWRLTALASCHKCEVQRFRLLVAVSPPALSISDATVGGEHASHPQVQVFPLSREEMGSTSPSFFSSAQYFRLLKDGRCVEAAEAFRRIQEGDVHQLCYVVAEYVAGDFECDSEGRT